jgi:hypothetical protein
MKPRLFRIVVTALIACVLSIPSFAQEMPKPGTIIDKNNYKQYAHLFPPEFLPAFENGFDGLLEPIKIKTAEARPVKLPKAFVALSEKNRGKYDVNADGLITGGFDSQGFPFPGVTPADKNFALKLMWNYNFAYTYDDSRMYGFTYLRRKGEPARTYAAEMPFMNFVGRIVVDPRPFYPTPTKLRKAGFFLYTMPDAIKNTMTLTYRYLDFARADEVYLYLPALRRTLRGEAGQRSAPMAGSLQALDDSAGFDGRTPEFTYKFVGEQKVLAPYDSTMNVAAMKNLKTPQTTPYQNDGWEARDTYVVDIMAKSPRYPQSKKRVYLDKETLMVVYSLAWDRANKLWKVWSKGFVRLPLGNGETYCENSLDLAVDVQMGMGQALNLEHKMNVGMKYEEVTVSSLPKKARQ